MNNVMFWILVAYMVLVLFVFLAFKIWTNNHSINELFFSGSEENKRNESEIFTIILLCKDIVPFSMYILIDLIRIL